MQIIYKKSFKKKLSKQPLFIKKHVLEKLSLLLTNPYHSSLRRHTLKGKLSDIQSLDVTSDIRIHFFEYKKTYILIDIGTHSELY